MCRVLKALQAKAARREGTAFESELLGRKVLEDRVGLGVRGGGWSTGREGSCGWEDMVLR